MADKDHSIVHEVSVIHVNTEMPIGSVAGLVSADSDMCWVILRCSLWHSLMS